MKKIALLAFTCLLPVAAEAQIQQAVCLHSGYINTTIIGDSGSWVGASVRGSNGQIEDIPPQELSMTGINYNFKFNSNASEFRVSTWKSYGGGLMHGRISDTGWQSCN